MGELLSKFERRGGRTKKEERELEESQKSDALGGRAIVSWG